MTKKAEAKKLLEDVPKPKAFWLVDGTIANNLDELATKLKVLNPDQLEYHINDKKDDIEKWIREVIGDTVLASKLRRETKKKKYINLIIKRLRSLKLSTLPIGKALMQRVLNLKFYVENAYNRKLLKYLINTSFLIIIIFLVLAILNLNYGFNKFKSNLYQKK